MRPSNRLYREAALERLSSPEQLDQQLQVTSARGWVALAAIWALLAAVVTWSIVGRVPTREEGQGIIVASGGLKIVVSEGAGRLSEIRVSVDDVIEANQVVATVDKHDLINELGEARSQLAELETQHERHEDLDRREEELQETLGAQEKERLAQIAAFSSERIERLRERRTIVEELVQQGNMTPIEIHKIDEDIEDAQLSGAKALLEIQQLDARNRGASFQRERERMQRVFRIDEIRGKITLLESRLEHESQVRSQQAGRVVEIRAALHTTVNVGDPILLIEPAESESGELEAILFVSAATGKRVEEGMEVHVSPSTVKREEYGSMIGRIRSISDVPTSRSAMLAVLSDNDLVERFFKEIGTPLQAEVALDRVRAPGGGYAYSWTSREAPPVKVSAGTLCTASVTVEEQRPIELVIPMIKKKLGFD